MRRSMLAWLVALPALPWLFEAVSLASRSALGRDQGIFQYVAWAISDGEKLYRDVRDVNGPLVPLVHLLLSKLGGDATFRALDIAFSFFAFAFAGACLPSLAKREVSSIER